MASKMLLSIKAGKISPGLTAMRCPVIMTDSYKELTMQAIHVTFQDKGMSQDWGKCARTGRVAVSLGHDGRITGFKARILSLAGYRLRESDNDSFAELRVRLCFLCV